MRVVRKALTFDDVLLVPAHSLVVPNEVSLKTRLTASVSLNIPLLSAAMDTVTETRLAIAIAQEGGLGVVHKNMPPAKQAAEVAKVKRFESGVVKDPITIPPTMSVREVLALTRQHRISGLPVVDGLAGGGAFGSVVVAAAGVASGDHRSPPRRTMPIAALSALPPQISSKWLAFSLEPRPGTPGVLKVRSRTGMPMQRIRGGIFGALS